MIPENSVWRFIGKGRGNGSLQHVIHNKDGEVITWGGGFTWRGSEQDFLNQFQRHS